MLDILLYSTILLSITLYAFLGALLHEFLVKVTDVDEDAWPLTMILWPIIGTIGTICWFFSRINHLAIKIVSG